MDKNTTKQIEDIQPRGRLQLRAAETTRCAERLKSSHLSRNPSKNPPRVKEAPNLMSSTTAEIPQEMRMKIIPVPKRTKISYKKENNRKNPLPTTLSYFVVKNKR